MYPKSHPPTEVESVTRSKALDASGDDAANGLALVVSSTSGVTVIPLPPRDAIVIGRSAESDVVIADASVSRAHARLRVAEGRLSIEDLGSSNGTIVDDKPLAAGDRAFVRIGSTFEVGSTTIVVQRARGLLNAEVRAPTIPPARARPSAAPAAGGPIVHDPAMRRLYALLDVLAPSPLSVLILGETGTGKEVFAESVHKRSHRADKPFLQLNCAALPESILEGELFGYEKGAFTGATQAKAGLFESADGGTVFLDEVGEIPMTIQAKLLRVLESGEVMRLGSLKPKRVDVRFVAATNRDLRALIVESRFRSDLYFRLNGTTITLPPLRARLADVLPLAHMFAARTAARLGRDLPTFAADATDALLRYTWPGNIRELRNVVERAVVMCGGAMVTLDHVALDPEVPRVGGSRPPQAERTSTTVPIVEQTGQHASLRVQIETIEKQRILDALTQTAGNQSHAAKMLGLARSTFVKKLELYGIARPRKGRS